MKPIFFAAMIFFLCDLEAYADAGCGYAPWYDIFCNYYILTLSLMLLIPTFISSVFFPLIEKLLRKKVVWSKAFSSFTVSMIIQIILVLYRVFNTDEYASFIYLIVIHYITYTLTRVMIEKIPHNYKKIIHASFAIVGILIILIVSVGVFAIIKNSFF